MLARYASAVTTGTFVTFALLFVMQLLITLQPGARTEKTSEYHVDWIKQAPAEEPVIETNELVDKKRIAESTVLPPRTTNAGGLDPILISSGEPLPPTTGGYMPTNTLPDGPLVVLVRVSPVYPARAQANGIEGYVVLQFDVTANGRAANIVVIESTDTVFNRAAIKAAERFKFRPRIVDGRALESHGIQNLFRFRLDDN